MIICLNNKSYDTLVLQLQNLRNFDKKKILTIAFINECPEPGRCVELISKYASVIQFNNSHITVEITKALSADVILFNYGCTFEKFALCKLPGALKQVHFGSCKLTKSLLVEILEFNSWEIIDFSCCELNDSDINYILSIPTWKVINIGGNNISEEMFETLMEKEEYYNELKAEGFREPPTKEKIDKIKTIFYLFPGHLHYERLVPYSF